MKLRLSHYGWMVTRQQALQGSLRLGNAPKGDLLIELFTGSHVSAHDYPFHPGLVAEGILEVIPENTLEEETRLRYKRNPFEHISKVIFEFTTYCNFNCEHCYNGHVPRRTETHLDLLKNAAETLLAMGVDRFDFVGGEVSKYGDGWLELVDHIHGLEEKAQISLYTNGWWLDQENFLAAGKTYADLWSYLADLKAHGVTHITFSLDGPGELHDRSRHQPGLYERILKGLAQVKEAGLEPRVSLLLRKEWDNALFESFLAEPATIIYDMDPDTPAGKRALRLHLDPFNAISNFIDIGNGAGDEQVQFPLLDAPNYPLYCRGFYRLSPSLTIKANGEIASCRLATAGEGYGNLHEKSMIEIVNHFDEAFISRLHIERRLEEYLPLVDRNVFGDQFSHLCSLRAVITLLARRMDEQGVGMDDIMAIQRINQEVALETGHLPRKQRALS
jgi:MoaA/NifB/PqqE/SkfB family radical SAM enzyme